MTFERVSLVGMSKLIKQNEIKNKLQISARNRRLNTTQLAGTIGFRMV